MRYDDAGRAVDTALYQLKRFTESADKIRANSTTAAKTLGGLGSAIVAALGVAKFSDVFPIPSARHALCVAALVLVGFLMMGGAVLWLTSKFWKVSDPIFTTTDPETMGLKGDEKTAVEKVYQQTAELNLGQEEADRSFKGYEQKALDLEKEAESKTIPEARRAENLARANAIRNDIRATQAHAAAVVVRKRAAIFGPALWVPAIVFALGLAVSNLSADALDAWRTSDQEATPDKKVATAKACADAVEARVKNNISVDGLPPECTLPTAPAEKAASPKPRLSDAIAGLSKIYSDCRQESTAERNDCEWIVTLINKATG